MKARASRWRIVIAAASFLAISGFARAQGDANSLLSKALDLVEDNNARQDVAVLADAARQYPQEH